MRLELTVESLLGYYVLLLNARYLSPRDTKVHTSMHELISLPYLLSFLASRIYIGPCEMPPASLPLFVKTTENLDGTEGTR